MVLGWLFSKSDQSSSIPYQSVPTFHSNESEHSSPFSLKFSSSDSNINSDNHNNNIIENYTLEPYIEPQSPHFLPSNFNHKQPSHSPFSPSRPASQTLTSSPIIGWLVRKFINSPHNSPHNSQSNSNSHSSHPSSSNSSKMSSSLHSSSNINSINSESDSLNSSFLDTPSEYSSDSYFSTDIDNDDNIDSHSDIPWWRLGCINAKYRTSLIYFILFLILSSILVAIIVALVPKSHANQPNDPHIISIKLTGQSVLRYDLLSG
jgi:hypothetical protein